MLDLLRFVPKNYLSYALGALAHIPLPAPFNVVLNRWFVGRYGINMNVATKTLEQYPSIGALFTRDLREGCRPIGEPPCSPVDGTLRAAGPIGKDGMLEQIKEQSYSLEEFLQCPLEAKRFCDGTYVNLYLAPKDYHHIHSPVTGRVRKLVYVPGRLWPVNDWSLNTIPKLFAVNERVVVYLTTNVGEVAVVLVGATNVGKISVTFDTLKTNSSPWRKKKVTTKVFPNEKEGSQPSLAAGDRLGTFHLGSTVILLFDKGFVDCLSCAIDRTSRLVQYGETLLRKF